MSTTQTGTHTRSSWDGSFSILVLTGTCLLALAACGGDDMTPPPGPVTGAGTGAVGATAGTGTATAGTTGVAGMTAAPTGTAGRAGAGTAGSRPPATTAGTGASGTGSGAAGAPTMGTAGTGTAGTGTAGTGTATAGTGGAAGTGAGGMVAAAGKGGETPGGASCLDGITNYFEKGPFDSMQMRMGSINFYRPMVPAGCKVPVVHLANGTGASCSNYAASLNRLASHGFLACCYENANTGAGTQGLQALKTAIEAFPDLADRKFGSTGHSQGGQASFVVLQFAEQEFGADAKYAGLAMQPASGFGNQPAGGWQNVYGKIKSPMLMFSGRGTDGLVSQTWVQDGFRALADTVEAYHWTKQGGMHIPVPNGEEMQLSIAWFRWKLLGDQKACMAFKQIPMMDRTWEQVAVQAEAPCM